MAGDALVGPDDNSDAGIMQRLDDAQPAFDTAARGGGVDAGSSGIREQPVERRRDFRDPGLERRNRRAGGVSEQFVPRLRRIHHRFAIPQKTDRARDLFRAGLAANRQVGDVIHSS